MSPGLSNWQVSDGNGVLVIVQPIQLSLRCQVSCHLSILRAHHSHPEGVGVSLFSPAPAEHIAISQDTTSLTKCEIPPITLDVGAPYENIQYTAVGSFSKPLTLRIQTSPRPTPLPFLSLFDHAPFMHQLHQPLAEILSTYLTRESFGREHHPPRRTTRIHIVKSFVPRRPARLGSGL